MVLHRPVELAPIIGKNRDLDSRRPNRLKDPGGVLRTIMTIERRFPFLTAWVLSVDPYLTVRRDISTRTRFQLLESISCFKLTSIVLGLIVLQSDVAIRPA
jgi:hypothetical protein